MTTGITFDDWDGTTPDGAKYGNYRTKTWSGNDHIPGSDLALENPYHWDIFEASHSRGLQKHYYWFLGVPPLDTSSFAFCPGLPTVADHPTNRATNKVWDLLTQSKFNAGVFAGEFRETVDFISSSIKAIALSYYHLRRGNFKEAARSIADRQGKLPWQPTRLPTGGVGLLANNWLTYQYALLPLLQDVKSAYEYLTRTYSVVSHVKATAEDKGEGSRSLNGVTWDHKWSSICQIRCAVVSEVSTLDRLGLTDPASVAWELTRLSFVFDWLIPVGNFLKAVNARRLVQTRNLMATQSIKESLRNPKWTGNGGFYPLEPVISADYSSICYGRRFALASLPVAIPTIENPLGDSMTRFLSASALLSQTFGRGK